MQIPQTVLKTVGFIGAKRQLASQKSFYVDLRGTVFFVGVPLFDGRQERIFFAVTAAHVIRRIEELGVDATAYIQINKIGGGRMGGTVKTAEWVIHDDPRVDAAITPFYFDARIHDVEPIAIEHFLSEQDTQKEFIGPGDDLFFPGLFTRHFGREENIPIMRLGSIAAMPQEAIQTDEGMLKAYLAEARSIGGLSGSPVFVHTGPWRGGASGSVLEHVDVRCRLFGLVHGHYDTRYVSDIADGVDDRGSRSINMGIALVVPVKYIRELLDHPTISSIIQKTKIAAEEIIREGLPVEDLLKRIDDTDNESPG